MDGYIIVASSVVEPLELIQREGVRHVAELDNGETFVAFNGDVPCPGRLYLNRPETLAWWRSVRHIAPASADETEHLAIVTVDRFLLLMSDDVLAVSLLEEGTRLVMTRAPIASGEGTMWAASSVAILDTRLVPA